MRSAAGRLGREAIFLLESPLAYLFAEEKQGDRQAREALFCTFNADLGHFERAVLGVIQSAGARATIVGDAWVSDPDPRAARNAGTRYVHGLAVPRTGGAFHPKVTVIAGPERAVVAVGSGNLSIGGWHLNAETWTITTADNKRCPLIVPQVADWLRTLESVCAITPLAVMGINRTAAQLEELAAVATGVDTGHRLVHNSNSPLIDQLPEGDVDQLLLYAPFHDERAEGVRELIERLLPNRVTLAVQSGGRTVIQPDTVRQVLADLGVDFEVMVDMGKQYRHGKLVEAVASDSSRWTLTGSPNLSSRALLCPAPRGGNIEVGVIARPLVSMFPTGCAHIDLGDVPAVRIKGTGASRALAGMTLLSAVRAEDGLQLIFARPVATPTRILASSGVDFDEWSDIGTVPAGVAEYVMTNVDVPGGTRIRCEWSAGADVPPGSIIFVTDPQQTDRRLGDAAQGRQNGLSDPITLITDPKLLQHWLSSINEIASARSSSTLRRASAPAMPQGENAKGKPGSGLRLDTSEEDWLACTDDAQTSLGPAMASFVLGGVQSLRALWNSDSGSLRLPTDKVVEDNRPGLDVDDETIVEDGASSGPEDAGNAQDNLGETLKTQTRDLPEAERRRLRRLLTTQVMDEARLASLSCTERLAILTLVLIGVQSGIWDGPLGENGWFGVSKTILKELGQAEIPQALSTRVGSWAAVGLYLMHEHRPATGHAAEAKWYEDAAQAMAHLLVDADEDLVSTFGELFTNANGYPVDPDAVMQVVDVVVQGDPLGQAADILSQARPHWRVDRHNATLLHVNVDARSVVLPAAEALDAIPGDQLAAVWATGSTQAWSIAIRDTGTLIRVDKGEQGQVTWQHFRLGPLTSPVGIARDPEQASGARIRHKALSLPFDEAVRALIAAGINPSADSPSECPTGTT
jgi:hypothetical protein